MPVVSTKLSDAEFKILKSLAQRENRTVASFVRLQLKPKINSNLPASQARQQLSTSTNNNNNNMQPSLGRIKAILKEGE